jgi:hypothetical protein
MFAVAVSAGIAAILFLLKCGLSPPDFAYTGESRIRPVVSNERFGTQPIRVKKEKDL